MIKPFWVLGIGAAVQDVVGPSSYGVYFTMLNFSFLFHIILDFGINNFQNRNISQNPKAASQLLSSLAIIKLGFGVVFLILILVVGEYVMNYPPTYLNLLWIVAGNQVLLSIVLFLRANLAGLQFFKVDSVISVLDRLLMILICSVLLWGNVTAIPFQIEWFAYAQGAAYFITILVALAIILLEVRLKFVAPKFGVLPGLIKKSFPFALLTLIMTLYYRIDVIMIEELTENGVFEAGVYAQGYRLPEMASMFSLLFATLLLPMFSKMIVQKESVIELMTLSFRLLITPAIISAVVIYFYGMDFVQMFFSVARQESSDVQTILMFTFIPLASTYVFGTLLTANGDLKALNIISVVGLLVNVGLNFQLIPTLGINGAALATLATQIIVVSLQLVYIGIQFKTRPNWKLLLSLGAFSIGLFFVGFGLSELVLNHKITGVVLIVFSVVWALVTRMISIKGIYHILKYQ